MNYGLAHFCGLAFACLILPGCMEARKSSDELQRALAGSEVSASLGDAFAVDDFGDSIAAESGSASEFDSMTDQDISDGILLDAEPDAETEAGFDGDPGLDATGDADIDPELEPDVTPDSAEDNSDVADGPDGQGCDPKACDDGNPCTDDSCSIQSGCTHSNNALQLPCYSGPPGTAGKGACKGSNSICAGGQAAACMGEVTPTTESCNGLDDDCNGQTDDGDAAKTCGLGAECLAASCAAAGSPVWAQGFDGGNSGEVHFMAVAADGPGNVYTAGFYKGKIDFGGGILASSADSYDALLASFDSKGKYRWAKVLGDADEQVGWPVAADGAGNVYTAGRQKGEVDFGGGALKAPSNGCSIFVASYDGAGKYRWTKSFGISTAGAQAYGIATDKSNNVYIVGSFQGTADFAGMAKASVGGSSDIFLVSLASDGKLRWVKTFGDDKSQSGVSIAADGNGNVYLMAKGAGPIDFGGGTGNSSSASTMFVASFDADGKLRWNVSSNKTIGSESGGAIAVDSGGNVFLTGYLGGTVNFGGGPLSGSGIFAASLDTQGKYRWAKTFGDGQGTGTLTRGLGIATDVSGNIYMAGMAESVIDFGGGALTCAGTPSVFAASLDTNGKYRWGNVYGNSKSHGWSIAAGANGRVYLGGIFNGQIAFGAESLKGSGESQAGFLAAFVP